MNYVRVVFALLCGVFLLVFWVASIAYMIDTGASAPWLIWVFLGLPVIYGVTELFAYIVRIGGGNE